MTAGWRDVRCACIPAEDLRVLADLRGRAQIRVVAAHERAWIWWEADPDMQQEILARRILPLVGAELFTERDGRWYRLGEHLPAFGVPPGDGATGVSLERMILPIPIAPEPPGGEMPEPVRVRVVREERGRARPASALRCGLGALAAWAEDATSAELDTLLASWTGGGDGRDLGRAAEPEVLVLGKPGMLPLLPEGVRLWGTDLLVPLGFRADPDLPETALLGALGAGAGDLAVLDEQGYEILERSVFQRLSRASIRIAWDESQAVKLKPAEREPG